MALALKQLLDPLSAVADRVRHLALKNSRDQHHEAERDPDRDGPDQGWRPPPPAIPQISLNYTEAAKTAPGVPTGVTPHAGVRPD